MAKFLKAKSNGTVVNFDPALAKTGKYDVIELGASTAPVPVAPVPSAPPDGGQPPEPEPAKARGRRKSAVPAQQE